MELALGLVAVSAAVAAVVLFVAMPRIGTPGRTTLFLRFAAVAGICAVGSSAMYFIYTAGGGILSLVLGDVAMVLAPSLLLVAVSVLDGRSARRTSVAIVALILVVAIVTATVPLPGSLVVKALALALACGACAAAALRADIDPVSPVRLIALTNAVFAVYCVVRVVVGVVAGWDSALYLVGFSYAPATVLGASRSSCAGSPSSACVSVDTRGSTRRPVRTGPSSSSAIGNWPSPPTARIACTSSWRNSGRRLATSIPAPSRCRAVPS